MSWREGPAGDWVDWASSCSSFHSSSLDLAGRIFKQDGSPDYLYSACGCGRPDLAQRRQAGLSLQRTCRPTQAGEGWRCALYCNRQVLHSGCRKQRRLTLAQMKTGVRAPGLATWVCCLAGRNSPAAVLSCPVLSCCSRPAGPVLPLPAQTTQTAAAPIVLGNI